MPWKRSAIWISMMIVLLLGLAACDTGEASPTPTSKLPASSPTPPPTEPPLTGNIQIWETYRAIEGFDWPANTEMTLALLSGIETEKERHFLTTTADGQIRRVELESAIEEGDLLVVTVSEVELTIPVHIPTIIADPERNLVYGWGEPGAWMNITLVYPADKYNDIQATADQEGYFEFDLSAITEWGDDNHFWITHAYHKYAATVFTNETRYISYASRTGDAEFISTRLTIPDLATSQTGNILMDFDNDGDLDLIINQFDWPPPQDARPVLAYRNDGKGNFTEASSEVFAGAIPTTTNATYPIVEDFNGDGLEDLFIPDGGKDHPPHGGGQSRLLIQNASGQLVDETEIRLPQIQAFTHYASAGDIDNDGDLDIYMCNIPGSPNGPAFYINDGEGNFSAETRGLHSGIVNLRFWFASSTFIDYDLDGDLDLFLGGTNYPYDNIQINDGTGNFSFAPTGTLPERRVGETSLTVAAISEDFNNDGWQDLLLSTHIGYLSDVTLQLLYNNGDGTFRDETALIEQDWITAKKPGCPEEYGNFWLFGLQTFDADGDGWFDFFAAGAGCMPSLLFSNNQGERFSMVENYNEVAREDSYSTRYLWSVALGDLDGDLDLDAVLFMTAVDNLVSLRD